MNFNIKTIPEVLQEINDGDTLVLLTECKDNAALKNILGHAFIPKGKFLLPSGTPPYTEDSAPKNMNPSNLWVESKSLSRFIRQDLKPSVRENLFIQMLEKVHPTESKLLLLIKDQNLESEYPNITLDKVVDSGFFIWPHGIDREEYVQKRQPVIQLESKVKVKKPRSPKNDKI